MAVEIEGKAEMAFVLRGVSRLFHRLQQNPVDEEFVFFFPHVLQYALKGKPPLRICLVRDAEDFEKLLEILQFLPVRWLMDAVDERALLIGDEAGHSLVRRDHELLDDALREEALRPVDVFYAALHVEHQLRLGQIEVEVAPLLRDVLSGCGLIPPCAPAWA